MKDLEWSPSIFDPSQPQRPWGRRAECWDTVSFCVCVGGMRIEHAFSVTLSHMDGVVKALTVVPGQRLSTALPPWKPFPCIQITGQRIWRTDHFKMSSQVFRRTTTMQVSSYSKSHFDHRILLNWKPTQRWFHVIVQSSAVRGILYFYIETELLDSSGSTFHSTFYTKFWRMVKIKILGAVVNRGLILLEVASYLLKHDVNKIGIFRPVCISVFFFLKQITENLTPFIEEEN